MVVRALVGGLVVNGQSAAPVIRTPDQRLRIFVSSTLRELEPERVAARRAIERLHLAPVMFELGARPHPPRDLYRAYLAQSDVFIGVYWQQYGWIAPGEEISGLEDEYRLAPRDMPKLIYVKQPAERDERLAALMARIRDDDTASYTPFATADELAERIEADLATLLAERFDASRASGEDNAPTVAALPMPSTGVIGRDAEVATLLEWLAEEDGRRLVTLVGAGGIGKTRLALEVARLARDAFDRVTFVALEHVREDRDVLPAIARGFGVRDLGDRPLIDRLAVARAGRRDLIVLDNFEQVASSAPLVATLLTALPDAKALVTSRFSSQLSQSRSVATAVSRPTASVVGAGMRPAIAGTSAAASGTPSDPVARCGRDASNRSASSVARSPPISSQSSSTVVNGVYDALSSSRIRAMRSVRRSSRSAGCFT